MSEEKTDPWGDLPPTVGDAPETNVFPTIVLLSQGAGFALKIGADQDPIGSEFSGSIVYQHPSLKKYATKKLGGAPPICVSVNGITGQGNPGGECAVCPWNYSNASKQVLAEKLWCQKHHLAYVIREGFENAGPVAVQIPVKSLTPFGIYMKSLEIESIHPARVITKFSVKIAEGDSGPYGVLHCTMGEVTPEVMIGPVVAAAKFLPGTEQRSLPPAEGPEPKQLPGGDPEGPKRGASSWKTQPTAS